MEATIFCSGKVSGFQIMKYTIYMKKSSLEQYYGNDRASKVIYGTILIFAYLVTQSHDDGAAALELVIGTFFAAVAIVLAEIYAEILGKTIRHKRKMSKDERVEVERDSFAIISVSFWPSFLFLLSYIGLYSVQTAFMISYSFLLGILFVFSFWASRLSEQSQSRAVMTATIISALGLAVVFAKYFLGH